jgi:hypothetical protein
MKSLTALIFCLLSYPAVAEIVPPPPNYTVSGDTVIDSQGEQNDDPQHAVTLTTQEAPVVNANDTVVDNNLLQSWIVRRNGDIARAAQSPQLIK